MDNLQLPEETLDYGTQGLKGINRKKKITPEDLLKYRYYLSKAEQAQIPMVRPLNTPEFGASTYDDDVHSYEAAFSPTAARADRQSTLMKLTNTVGGGIIEGLLTAGETLGYIGDLAEHMALKENSDAVTSNIVSDMFKQLKESSRDMLPVYEDPGNLDGIFNQFVSWGSARSMIDSSIGFAIPGGAVAKGINLTFKGIKGLRILSIADRMAKVADDAVLAGRVLTGSRKILNSTYGKISSRFAQETAKSALGGLVTNHAEGTMMAIEMAELAEQDYISRNGKKILDEKYGGDESFKAYAEKEAEEQMASDKDFQATIAQQQQSFQDKNMIFMVTDALALRGIFKGKGVMFGNELLQRGSRPYIGKMVKDQALQSVKETGEEIGQSAFQSEGTYQINRQQGTVDKSTEGVVGRFLNFATSDQAIVEGLMGAVSGPLQSFGAKKVNDILGGDALGKKRLAEYDKTYNEQQELRKNLGFTEPQGKSPLADPLNYSPERMDKIVEATVNNINNAIETTNLAESAQDNGLDELIPAIKENSFEALTAQAYRLGVGEYIDNLLYDLEQMSDEEANIKYGTENKTELLNNLKNIKEEVKNDYIKSLSYKNSEEAFTTMTKRKMIGRVINAYNKQLDTEISNLYKITDSLGLTEASSFRKKDSTFEFPNTDEYKPVIESEPYKKIQTINKALSLARGEFKKSIEDSSEDRIKKKVKAKEDAVKEIYKKAVQAANKNTMQLFSLAADTDTELATSEGEKVSAREENDNIIFSFEKDGKVTEITEQELQKTNPKKLSEIRIQLNEVLDRVNSSIEVLNSNKFFKSPTGEIFEKVGRTTNEVILKSTNGTTNVNISKFGNSFDGNKSSFIPLTEEEVKAELAKRNPAPVDAKEETKEEQKQEQDNTPKIINVVRSNDTEDETVFSIVSSPAPRPGTESIGLNIPVSALSDPTLKAALLSLFGELVKDDFKQEGDFYLKIHNVTFNKKEKFWGIEYTLFRKIQEEGKLIVRALDSQGEKSLTYVSEIGAGEDLSIYDFLSSTIELPYSINGEVVDIPIPDNRPLSQPENPIPPVASPVDTPVIDKAEVKEEIVENPLDNKKEDAKRTAESLLFGTRGAQTIKTANGVKLNDDISTKKWYYFISIFNGLTEKMPLYGKVVEVKDADFIKKFGPGPHYRMLIVNSKGEFLHINDKKEVYFSSTSNSNDIISTSLSNPSNDFAYNESKIAKPNKEEYDALLKEYTEFIASVADTKTVLNLNMGSIGVENHLSEVTRMSPKTAFPKAGFKIGIGKAETGSFVFTIGKDETEEKVFNYAKPGSIVMRIEDNGKVYFYPVYNPNRTPPSIANQAAKMFTAKNLLGTIEEIHRFSDEINKYAKFRRSNKVPFSLLSNQEKKFAIYLVGQSLYVNGVRYIMKGKGQVSFEIIQKAIEEHLLTIPMHIDGKRFNIDSEYANMLMNEGYVEIKANATNSNPWQTAGLNGHLTFDRTPAQPVVEGEVLGKKDKEAPKEIIKKEEEAASEFDLSPETDIFLEDQDDTELDKKVVRKLNTNLTYAMSKEVLDEELAWLKAKFPNLNISIVKKILSSGTTVGRLVSATEMLLAEDAPIGTAFHEAFHLVFNFFLDRAERISLLKLVTDNVNLDQYAKDHNLDFSKLNTNEEKAEEVLAEMFSEYKVGNFVLPRNKSSVWSMIKVAFKKLLGRLLNNKAYLIDKDFNATINRLFSYIETNKFDIDSVTNTSLPFNKSKTIGGLNPKMNKEILNSLHYYVLQFIRDSTNEGIESLLGHKKTAILSQAMAFANKEIRKVGEDTLREEKRLLKEIQSLDATNEANASKIEELSVVYNRTKKIRNILQYVVLTPDKGGMWTKNGDNGVLDIYEKFLLGFNINANIIEDLSTEEAKNTLAEEEAVRLGTVPDMKVSAKQSATKAIRLLLSSLPEISNIMENGKSVERVATNAFGLVRPAQSDKVFSVLLSAFGNSLHNISKQEIIERLNKAASRYASIKPLFQKYGGQNSWLKLDSGEEFTALSNINLLSAFVSTFARSKTDYHLTLATDRLGGTVEDHVASKSTRDTYLLMKNRSVESALEKIMNLWKGKINYSNSKLFIYDKEKNRFVFNKTELEKYKNAKKLVFLQQLGISFSSTTIHNSNTAEQISIIANDLLHFCIRTPDVDLHNDKKINEFFSSLARKESKYGISMFSQSHTNINGDEVFDYGLYSFVTSVIQKLNNLYDHLSKGNAGKDLFPFLENSRYTQSSSILHMMNTSKSAKLSYDVFEGVVNVTDDKPSSFETLTTAERDAIWLMKLDNDEFELSRPSDNAINRYISFHGFKIFDRTNGDAYAQMLDYLKDELEAALETETTTLDSTGAVVKVKLRNTSKNKHNNIMIKAFELDESILSKLNSSEAITKFIEQKANDEGFKNIFYANVGKLVNSFKEKAIKGQTIKRRSKDGKIEYLVPTKNSPTTIMSEEKLNEYLTNSYLKFIAWIQEEQKLFYSNITQFANPAAVNKRRGGAVGTKLLSYIGKEFRNAIEKLPRLDNKYSDKYFANRTNPIMRTVVFEELKVTSDYLVQIARIVDRDKVNGEKLKNLTEQELKDYILSHKSEFKASSYMNMDEGDGFGYISLDAYRETMISSGSWSSNLERAYQYEVYSHKNTPDNQRFYVDYYTGQKTTEVLTTEVYDYAVFNPLKLQYFGPMATNIDVKTMYKFSVTPITPSLAKQYPDLRKLMDRMIAEKIELGVYYSANKGVETLVNEDGKNNALYTTKENGTTAEISSAPWFYQDIYSEYLGIQQSTGSEAHRTTPGGTQQAKIIVGGIYDAGQVSTEFPIEARERLAEKVKTYFRFNRLRLEKLLKNYFIKLGINPQTLAFDSLDKLVSTLESEGIKRNMPNTFMDFVTILQNSLKQGKDISEMIEASPYRSKIEEVLMSSIMKQAIQPKRKGMAAYQTAPSMFSVDKKVNPDGTYGSSELKVLFDSNGNFLGFEVYLPHYLQGKYKKGDTLRGLGFRIPTQALSSMEYIRVAGFLPKGAGDQVVLPSEIVAKAGSDYDIDKLFILLPNTFVNANGVETEINYNTWEQQFAEFKLAKQSTLNYIIGQIVGDYSTKLSKIISENIESINSAEELLKVLEEKISTANLNPVERTELENILAGIGIAYMNDSTIFDSYFDLLDRDKFEFYALENATQEAEFQLLSDPARNSSWIAPLGMDNMKSLAREMNKLTNNPRPFDDPNVPVLSFIDRNYLNELNEMFLGGSQTIELAASFMSSHIQAQYSPLNLPFEHFLLSKKSDKIRYGKKYINEEITEVATIGGLYTEDGYYIPELINEVLSLGADVVKEPAMRDLGLNPNNMMLFLMMISSQMSPRTALYILNNPMVKEYMKEKNATFITNAKKRPIKKTKDLKASVRNRLAYASKGGATPQEIFKNLLTDNKNELALETVQLLERYFNPINKVFSANKFDTKGVTANLIEGFLTLQKTLLEGPSFDESHTDYLDNNFGTPYRDNAQLAFEAVSSLFSKARAVFRTLSDTAASFPLTVQKKVYGDTIAYKMLEKMQQNHNIIALRKELMSGPNSVARQVLAAKELVKNDFLDILVPVISGSETEFDYIKPNVYKLDTDTYNAISYAWERLFSTNPKLASDLVIVGLLQSGVNRDSFSYLFLCPPNSYYRVLNSFNGLSLTSDNEATPVQYLILNNIKSFPKVNKYNGVITNRYVGPIATNPKYSKKILDQIKDNGFEYIESSKWDKETTYDVYQWEEPEDLPGRYVLIAQGVPVFKGTNMNLQVVPQEVSDFKTIKSLLNKMINGDEETPFVEMSETAEEELPVFPESKSRKVTYAEPLVVNNKGSVKVKALVAFAQILKRDGVKEEDYNTSKKFVSLLHEKLTAAYGSVTNVNEFYAENEDVQVQVIKCL